MPKTSIIIPTYNGLEHLKKCLSSLSKQNFKDYEAIVVDNNSSDGTLEFLRKEYPDIRVIRNKTNLGFAGANNIGYANCSGEYVLFLNNDTVHEPSFLEWLVNVMDDRPDIGVCSSKIYLMDNQSRFDELGAFLTPAGFLHHVGLFEKDNGQYNNMQEFFVVKGVCFLVRRKVIEEVGLFQDNYFSYFEESDLFWRVWLANYKIVYVPESVIYHKVGCTSTKINSSIIDYHSFKNRICTLIKNLEIRTMLWMLPIHIFCCCSLSVLQFLKRNISGAYALNKAIIWNIVNLPATLQKRKIVQNKIRKKSDRELFKMMMINNIYGQFAKMLYLTIFVRKNLGRLKIKDDLGKKLFKEDVGELSNS